MRIRNRKRTVILLTIDNIALDYIPQIMTEQAGVKKDESKEDELFIFSEEDIKTVQRLKYGVLIKPLQFLAVSSALVVLAKKLNLRRLIANPFRDE